MCVFIRWQPLYDELSMLNIFQSFGSESKHWIDRPDGELLDAMSESCMSLSMCVCIGKAFGMNMCILAALEYDDDN